MLAFVAVGIVCGAFILKLFVKTAQVNFVSVIVGVFVYNLLLFIPYIGPLIMITLYLIVFGGILTLLYRSFRP
jgi:hypothetical protein